MFHFQLPRAAFSIALVLVLTVIATFTFSEAHAALPQTLSVESLLNPDGTLNLTNSADGAVDLRGWNVALDSKRGPVLSPASSALDSKSGPVLSPVSNLQSPISNPQSPVSAPSAPTFNDTWSTLPNNGLNTNVYALAVFNNALYVGGAFTQTADASVTNLNYIAKFDGSAWSALPNNGLSHEVYALAVCRRET